MAYKQQKILAHSSGGWKPKIRVSAWLSPGESLLLGYRPPTSPYILVWQKRQGISLGPLLWPNHFPKAPPPNTITLGIRNSTHKFWGDTNIDTIADVFFKARSQNDWNHSCQSERNLNKKCPFMALYNCSGIEVLSININFAWFWRETYVEVSVQWFVIWYLYPVCHLVLEIDMEVSGNRLLRNHLWWWSATLFSLLFFPVACYCAVETGADTSLPFGTQSWRMSIFRGLGLECFVTTDGFGVWSDLLAWSV